LIFILFHHNSPTVTNLDMKTRMDASLALQNLISPPVLFFALGLAAALARSDLAIPEAVAKALSLYLMLAIGFKGGVAAGDHGLGLDLLLVIGATGLIHSPLGYPPSLNMDLYFCMIGTLMLFIFMFTFAKYKLDRSEGVLYLLGFIVYMYVLFEREGMGFGIFF